MLIPTHGKWHSSQLCVKIQTSCWLVKCVTTRPLQQLSPSLKLDTSFLQRSIPIVPPKPSTESSTCSQNTNKDRCVCSCPILYRLFFPSVSSKVKRADVLLPLRSS